jgi:regulator of protease activity HflC (stomatin/prohibitin superfamily)
MDIVIGGVIGAIAWFMVRYFLAGLYTVDQNERAVKTIFGRAERIEGRTTLDDPIAEHLREDEKERYRYPQVRVIGPGGPYFKWPWEKIYKISVATQTINMAYDAEDPNANRGGTMLDAVTKDQLNIGLNGQIRYQVSERNLYAYLFGVKAPFIHVMGYFISVLRERIANFQAPSDQPALPGATPEEANIVSGVSINDLRKNLRDLNEHMERECLSSVARYGISLDASLITGIDPPPDVESALAAINTAHNHVSSDISLAQAAADQRIVQSRRAVEIETLNAHAEVEPLTALAEQLSQLKRSGDSAMAGYLRNVRLRLFSRASRAFVPVNVSRSGGSAAAEAMGARARVVESPPHSPALQSGDSQDIPQVERVAERLRERAEKSEVAS